MKTQRWMKRKMYKIDDRKIHTHKTIVKVENIAGHFMNYGRKTFTFVSYNLVKDLPQR